MEVLIFEPLLSLSLKHLFDIYFSMQQDCLLWKLFKILKKTIEYTQCSVRYKRRTITCIYCFARYAIFIFMHAHVHMQTFQIGFLLSWLQGISSIKTPKTENDDLKDYFACISHIQSGSAFSCNTLAIQIRSFKINTEWLYIHVFAFCQLKITRKNIFKCE